MDARIVRTRSRLQEAFFALAQERGIDQVSVSDIAERAGVNRSTFYQHYADKETLLADALDVVAQQAYEKLKEGLVLTVDPPEVLVGFIEHIDQYADLYRSVFSEPGWGVVLMRLRQHVRDAIVDVAARDETASPRDVPVEVVAAGVAGSIIGVLGAWLLTEPRPPASEAAMWVWRVILGPPVLNP
ncbi:TetR/AcrR family transcriptional regulator [Demequina aurantiaca]|uniref:TetR/AcrR family transcriptional regulator n=1 Tax=Demequina aurantiaca TaxID=676200 RepID=UPI003D33A893